MDTTTQAGNDRLSQKLRKIEEDAVRKLRRGKLAITLTYLYTMLNLIAVTITCSYFGHIVIGAALIIPMAFIAHTLANTARWMVQAVLLESIDQAWVSDHRLGRDDALKLQLRILENA